MLIVKCLEVLNESFLCYLCGHVKTICTNSVDFICEKSKYIYLTIIIETLYTNIFGLKFRFETFKDVHATTLKFNFMYDIEQIKAIVIVQSALFVNNELCNSVLSNLDNGGQTRDCRTNSSLRVWASTFSRLFKSRVCA